MWNWAIFDRFLVGVWLMGAFLWGNLDLNQIIFIIYFNTDKKKIILKQEEMICTICSHFSISNILPTALLTSCCCEFCCCCCCCDVMSCRDVMRLGFIIFVCLFILFSLCLLPPEKLDEMLAGGQQEVVLRARPSDDFRAATVKQRPTSRRITQAEINVSI